MITLAGCVAACVSPERATDYRQVAKKAFRGWPDGHPCLMRGARTPLATEGECAARNPCKHGKRISNPDGVTEFCRAFGTFKIFAFIAGVSPRFTACLCSVQAFGLPSTLARDSPPSEATGVFRAATGVAAAPQRGANPSFATEELGGGSLVDVVSQLLADSYNHTRKSKAVNTRIGLVAI